MCVIAARDLNKQLPHALSIPELSDSSTSRLLDLFLCFHRHSRFVPSILWCRPATGGHMPPSPDRRVALGEEVVITRPRVSFGSGFRPTPALLHRGPSRRSLSGRPHGKTLAYCSGFVKRQDVWPRCRPTAGKARKDRNSSRQGAKAQREP